MRQSDPAPVAGRYFLGQHLRAFERSWETADAGAKKRALPLVTRAVFAFFAGQPPAAGRALDDAHGSLKNDSTAEGKLARALAVAPVNRIVAPGGDAKLRLRLMYPVETLPTSLSVSVQSVRIERGRQVAADTLAQTNLDVAALSSESGQLLTFPIAGGADADLALRVSVVGNGVARATHGTQISRVANLSRRLAALAAPVSGDPSTLENLTARALSDLLAQIIAPDSMIETDYPASAWLADAEAARSRKPRWGVKQPGSFRLEVPSVRTATTSSVTLRLIAPRAASSGKPLPLLIALHGAGGSENLFVDGYGDGKLVRLCDERGWLLVTLRGGALPGGSVAGLLEAVEKLYPIDTKRVFLLGHSMGASQATAIYGREPERISALVALGGGGAFVAPPKGRAGRFFVAWGEQDFAAPGARALATAIERTEKGHGAPLTLDAREVAHTEHLTVVQDALADAIRFLDK